MKAPGFLLLTSAPLFIHFTDKSFRTYYTNVRGMGRSGLVSTPSIPVTAGQGRGCGVVHPSAMTLAPGTPPTATTVNGLGGLAGSVHAINATPRVVQDVLIRVGDDIQSPASTPEDEIISTPEESVTSLLIETEASLVYEYVFKSLSYICRY